MDRGDRGRVCPCEEGVHGQGVDADIDAGVPAGLPKRVLQLVLFTRSLFVSSGFVQLGAPPLSVVASLALSHATASCSCQ